MGDRFQKLHLGFFTQNVITFELNAYPLSTPWTGGHRLWLSIQPEDRGDRGGSSSCFQAFMTELSHEGMDTEESLQETVEVLFVRAVETPHSAAHFAELCQDLSKVSYASMTGSYFYPVSYLVD